eukprot:Sspe_Gene.9302::Locus_3132_Transcript_1_1_Confidence_1.000_Length_1438::g.9302::m.9302
MGCTHTKGAAPPRPRFQATERRPRRASLIQSPKKRLMKMVPTPTPSTAPPSEDGGAKRDEPVTPAPQQPNNNNTRHSSSSPSPNFTPKSSTPSSGAQLSELEVQSDEATSQDTSVLFFPDPHPPRVDIDLDDVEDLTSAETVLKLLQNADWGVRVCVDTISFDAVLETLGGLHEAGVKVQVLTSKGGLGEGEFDYEVREVDDPHYHLHHQFVIIDRNTVIHGPWDWNAASATKRNGNVVVSTNARVAHRFNEEFDHLWDTYAPHSDIFDTAARSTISRVDPKNRVIFFPDNLTGSPRKHDTAHTFLMKCISFAQHALTLSLPSLHPDIYRLLRAAQSRGVVVNLLVPPACAALASQLKRMGSTVTFHASLHEYFVVADRLLTLTGSYSWTMDPLLENIVLYTSHNVANLFESEFLRLKKAAGRSVIVTPPPEFH